MKKPILEITVFDDGSTKTRKLDNDFFYENKQIKQNNIYTKSFEKLDFSNDLEVYLSHIENNIYGSSSRISQIVLTVLYMCKLIDEYDNFDLYGFKIDFLKEYYTSYNPIKDDLNEININYFSLDAINLHLDDRKNNLEDYMKSYFNQSVKAISEYLGINTTAIRDKFDRQLGLKIDDIIYLLIGFIIYNTLSFEDILYERAIVSSKAIYDKKAINYMINEVAYFRNKI